MGKYNIRILNYENQRIKMRKKIGASTYIQRINTLERKLLKQVKELDDVIQKHPEIIFRLQVVEFAFKTLQ
jgi:selenocysteine lyase/cysteine desulfurase